VALLRIKDADLKHAARVLLKMQDAKNHQKIAIWAPSHTGYIFVTKACIDNRKKNLLNSNISSTCPDNIMNFGSLMAEIGLPV